MIAQYPPMGWNSWDCFGAAVTEDQVKVNADYMATHLKQYGWEYVVVDIQWYQPTAGSHEYEPFTHLNMDDYGRLLPAENRFPSAAGGKGFKPLSDYVHGLGLKFGIHIMRGMPRMAAHQHLPIYNSEFNTRDVADPNSICTWNPDMYGLKCQTQEAGARAYYESLFRLYGDWGVDFVKVDDIAREYPHCQREIELISESMHKVSPEMVLSLSPGPAPLEKAEHLKKYANMWRITDDFWDQWDLLLAMFERAEKWCTHAGPGHWPDADMLPVGALRQCEDPSEWTRFTEAEQITMMSLWCMMRAPMMIGGHLPKNDVFTLELLSNADVLDILRESIGGHQVYRTHDEILWQAYRKDGKGMYVAIFNIGEEDRVVDVNLADIEAEGYGHLKELWSREEEDCKGQIQKLVKKHGAVIYRLDI